MFTWFDIHTHQQQAPAEDVYALRNFYGHFDTAQQPCSIGLHPWYLQAALPGKEQLEQYAALPQVKAIGECGLDKVTATPWTLQLELFRFQVRLAMRLQKPLIVHCVRAWNEVLQILQEEQVNVPVIFHGFNKGMELADQVWRAGYYLSFGAALLRPDSPAAAVLGKAPPERFFLETDDSGHDIAVIYDAAAEIRKTGTNEVILQLQKNATTVFKL